MQWTTEVTQFQVNISLLETEKSGLTKQLEARVKEFTRTQIELNELILRFKTVTTEMTVVTKENVKLTTEITKIRNITIILETKITELEAKLKSKIIDSTGNRSNNKNETVQVNKLKDALKKVEQANVNLTADVKKLKDENSVEKNKVVGLVQAGLKSATQKLQIN